MVSRNKWIFVSTMILAICAIGFFCRNDLYKFFGTTPDDTPPNELAVPKADPSANDGKSSGSSAERERVAKHNEMLEGFRKEATAAAKKSSAASRSLPPPIFSITSGGDLSESVIHSLSLSASEVESLKKVVSEASSKEAKMFAERAERQPVTEDMDEGSVKYLIRAKRDRGAAEMKRLAEKVGQILDAPRSKQFMGGVGEFDCYGGFGKYDMEVTFYSEGDVNMVKERYLNPSTGNPTRFGAGSLDDPNYSFWKEVNLPKR